MYKIAKSISALLLSMTLLPGAFAQEQKDKQIATINGDPVMASELLTYTKVKNPRADMTDPATRQQMIQAYVSRELLFQEAIAQKIDQLPVVKMALENQRHEVISQALVAKIMGDTSITDEQIRAFYDKKAAEHKANPDMKTPMPEFENVKGQIRQLLIEQNVAMFVQSLQKKAKIVNTN